jgi:hypothetical protein
VRLLMPTVNVDQMSARSPFGRKRLSLVRHAAGIVRLLSTYKCNVAMTVDPDFDLQTSSERSIQPSILGATMGATRFRFDRFSL